MISSFQSRRGAAALPLREGRAPVRDRLTAMLFLTGLLHAIVILGVTFSNQVIRASSDTPQLDVLLVTNEVSVAANNPKAAYLAQRTQIGSGNTDEAVSPVSPQSRGATDTAAPQGEGNAANGSTDQAPESVVATTAPSSDIRYLANDTAGGQTTQPEPLGAVEGAPRSGRNDGAELLLRGKANAQHWVTPDTRESALAPYLAAWKRKVERVGTVNYPVAARDAAQGGSPLIEVDIAANGHLRSATVRRSSGHAAVDQAALATLRLASPFEPFPSELAIVYSQLRFAYQFQWDSTRSNPVTVSSDGASGP